MRGEEPISCFLPLQKFCFLLSSVLAHGHSWPAQLHASLAVSESFEVNFNRSRTTTIFLHSDYFFSAVTDVNPQSSTVLNSAALEAESKDGHVL